MAAELEQDCEKYFKWGIIVQTFSSVFSLKVTFHLNFGEGAFEFHPNIFLKHCKKYLFVFNKNNYEYLLLF